MWSYGVIVFGGDWISFTNFIEYLLFFYGLLNLILTLISSNSVHLRSDIERSEIIQLKFYFCLICVVLVTKRSSFLFLELTIRKNTGHDKEDVAVSSFTSETFFDGSIYITCRQQNKTTHQNPVNNSCALTLTACCCHCHKRHSHCFLLCPKQKRTTDRIAPDFYLISNARGRKSTVQIPAVPFNAGMMRACHEARARPPECDRLGSALNAAVRQKACICLNLVFNNRRPSERAALHTAVEHRGSTRFLIYLGWAIFISSLLKSIRARTLLLFCW